MNVLLVPVGSAGDVHPFVGLGQAMRARGHHVTLLANDFFRPLAERTGLDFVALGDFEEFQDTLNNPDLWHPLRSLRVVAESVARVYDRTFQAIAERNIPGETVMAAGSLGFAARAAEEKLGIPTATVHLQPGLVRSVYQTPAMPGLAMADWWPKAAKRFLYWTADTFFIDPAIRPTLNAFRARVGLPPLRRVLLNGLDSPRLSLCLFPSWYASKQPDWPPQAVLTEFPLFDAAGAYDVPPEVDAFLESGSPPIVFTPGSAMRHGQGFFRESVAACRRINRRGVLLTRFGAQVPTDLPPTVRHFEYVPFGQILPRCAALVHHGGIGTMSQAFAAGIPQVIMPLAHDQYDNAARVRGLQVGGSVPAKSYRAETAAAELTRVLGMEGIQERCAALAERMRGVDPFRKACDELEALLKQPTARTTAQPVAP